MKMVYKSIAFVTVVVFVAWVAGAADQADSGPVNARQREWGGLLYKWHHAEESYKTQAEYDADFKRMNAIITESTTFSDWQVTIDEINVGEEPRRITLVGSWKPARLSDDIPFAGSLSSTFAVFTASRGTTQMIQQHDPQWP
jgi:hypothetical protein